MYGRDLAHLHERDVLPFLNLGYFPLITQKIANKMSSGGLKSTCRPAFELRHQLDTSVPIGSHWITGWDVPL